MVSAQFVNATHATVAVALVSSMRDWLPWAVLAPLLFRLTERAPLGMHSSLGRVFLHLGALVFVVFICNLWTNMIDPGFRAGMPGGGPSLSAASDEPRRAPPPPPRENPNPFVGERPPPPPRDGVFRGRSPGRGPRTGWLQLDLVHIATFQLPLYLMLLCAAHAVVFYRRDQERAASLTKVRLECLKTQLQPHFLFNTLNAIAELVHEEPEKADAMLTALSQLLRVSLEAPSDQLVPLQTEIAFVEHYLEIMHMRFDNRLRYEFFVVPEAGPALVPPLLLQPLVENAIRHGLSATAEGGTVTIKATAEARQLHLIVQDNGVGFNAKGTMREGLGISNTRARLREFYGNDASLVFHNHTGTSVEMILPLQT